MNQLPGRICQCEFTSSKFPTPVTDCCPLPDPYLISCEWRRISDPALCNLITDINVTSSGSLSLPNKASPLPINATNTRVKTPLLFIADVVLLPEKIQQRTIMNRKFHFYKNEFLKLLFEFSVMK